MLYLYLYFIFLFIFYIHPTLTPPPLSTRHYIEKMNKLLRERREYTNPAEIPSTGIACVTFVKAHTAWECSRDYNSHNKQAQMEGNGSNNGNNGNNNNNTNNLSSSVSNNNIIININSLNETTGSASDDLNGTPQPQTKQKQLYVYY